MEIWQDEDESWEEDRESAAVTDEEGEDDGDEETEQSAARLPARIILILSRRSTDSMQSCVAAELSQIKWRKFCSVLSYGCLYVCV